MLRLICGVIVLTGALTHEARAGALCGDANGNGRLEAADAFLISGCVREPAACELDVASCDTNSDGVLSEEDVSRVASAVRDPSLVDTLTCAAGAGSGAQ